ncbi:MAG: type 4a pilus biogenesis protein PilO [Gammaproteobacteria bacterium]|nr:type 4a pilus biogenesis protein PilO [Gammaproteobacteria bacterium]MDE2346589.1 type 4a pilus biogenesis protein PilO [Gammaproteobacteria bacterium]
MDFSEFRNLDFRNPGSWPTPARVIAYIVIFAFVVLIGYYFWLSDDKQQLTQAQQQEVTLKTEFEQKAAEASHLEIYKAQIAQMKRSFGTMLRQLPGKTEIPSLLQDISQTAQIDGLKQDLFKPENEIIKDFYAEKPIQIQVEGTYHQFGKFVSDLAALPRIVTVHDVTIKPMGNNSNGANLIMSLTAKTYRYLEQNEEQEHGRKKPVKRNARPGK